MPYNVTTAATIKPITLDEIKSNLNLYTDFTDDDELLDGLIAVAVDYVENFTRRALLTQTITLTCDGFPNYFEIERPILQSVTSIQYIDSDGNTQTLGSSKYTIDTSSTPGRIVEAYGESWPSTQSIINSVTVTYKAGYTSAENVPNQIKQAMKILIGDWYKDRESYIVGVSNVNELPHTAKILLMPYQVAI